MYCKYCGALIDDDSIFCSQCGKKLSGNGDAIAAKAQWVDFLDEKIEDKPNNLSNSNYLTYSNDSSDIQWRRPTTHFITTQKDIKFELDTTEENEAVYIDWGDGNSENIFSREIMHKYFLSNVSNYITIKGHIYGLFLKACSLTLLDINGCTDFVILDCNENKLSFLDISRHAQLEILACGNNQLTALNIARNKELAGLICSSNFLSKLNVSKNSKLIHLECTNNILTSLNTSKNTALDCLRCQENQLTLLNVSKNIMLTEKHPNECNRLI